MTTAIFQPARAGILGLALALGGCAAPPPAPIELTVTVREAGICCQAGNLVTCRDRTAAIKAAYADPEQLHHTLAEIGFSDFDRPGTVERDRARTVEHDRGDTIEHDLLRCKFRNDQLRKALEVCRTDWNKCESENRTVCNEQYNACYNAALEAGPFDKP
jgi:hypothetical protein